MAMDLDFRVTSVELKATTDGPAAGINYQLVPVPTAGQKTVTMTAAGLAVANGIAGAELKQYKQSSADAIAVALIAGVGAPRQVAKLLKWSFKSRRNMATVVSLTVAFGLVLKSSGILDAAVFFVSGVVTWAKVTRDAYVETNEWVADFYAENEWHWESVRSTSMESWMCLAAIAVALWLNWGEVGAESPTSSTVSSGRETPIPPGQIQEQWEKAEPINPNNLLLEAIGELQTEQEEKWASFLKQTAVGKAVDQASKTQITDAAEENQKDILRLRSKVEAFEVAAMSDRISSEQRESPTAAPRKETMPHQMNSQQRMTEAPGLQGERLVDTHTTLPVVRRGNEEDGEPAVEESKTALPINVASIILELE